MSQTTQWVRDPFLCSHFLLREQLSLESAFYYFLLSYIDLTTSVVVLCKTSPVRLDYSALDGPSLPVGLRGPVAKMF